VVGSSPPEVLARPLGISGERALEIVSEDGVVLDGRIRIPDAARRAVVIAHPHPMYGGSMENPVVVALTRVLCERNVATLRFDFRGVGRSEGRHHGQREIDDTLAAWAAIRNATHLPTAIVGYSFGSWCALNAARRSPDVDRVGIVAPALTILDYGARCDRPVAMVLGDRDAFADATRARVVAGRVGASIAVLSGEDHFFSRSRRRVAELLAPFLCGERDRIDEGDLA
jgi:uncharacterized protein